MRARTCRKSFEVGKKHGTISDEEYKQALEEYKQALALIQTLEEKLPRTKTSGDNKYNIKEKG